MRAKVLLFSLTAYIASAQDASRVFHLHHIQTTQDLNEFATMVRTIADVRELSTDAAQKTMSVKGTASQIAIAEFLFTELDRQTVPDSEYHELRVSNADDVVHLFFLPHTASVKEFQEIVTAVRTVADIRRVFTYNSPRAVAVRGTGDQVALTDFLVRELDQPAEAKRADSRQYHMVDTSREAATAVRVFYLPYTSTVQQFQEVATLVRTIGEIRRVFTYNGPKALIVRGTPDQVALAGWLVQELGKPVTAGTASQLYTYPDVHNDGENIVRVFYVAGAPSVAAFQQVATQIRTTTKIRRVFTYNTSMAMALRGTEAQLALAQQILQDRGQQVALK